MSRVASSCFGAMLLPAPVLAAEGVSEGLGLFASCVQMIAALAIVVGLILVISRLGGRLAGTGGGFAGGVRYIRVVESRHLAPKKTLFLVEIAGEYLLIASSGDQMSFVKQVDMVEDIEVLGTIDERPSGIALYVERLKQVVNQFGQKPGSIFPQPGTGAWR